MASSFTFGPKQVKQIGLDDLAGPQNKGFSSNKTSPGLTSRVATSILKTIWGPSLMQMQWQNSLGNHFGHYSVHFLFHFWFIFNDFLVIFDPFLLFFAYF